MLFQLLETIKREKIVSVEHLTRTFQISLTALEPMLERWIKRGVIQRCQPSLKCASACMQCNTKNLVYYQMV